MIKLCVFFLNLYCCNNAGNSTSAIQYKNKWNEQKPLILLNQYSVNTTIEISHGHSNVREVTLYVP